MVEDRLEWCWTRDWTHGRAGGRTLQVTGRSSLKKDPEITLQESPAALALSLLLSWRFQRFHYVHPAEGSHAQMTVCN